MADPDAEPYQPHRKRRVRSATRIAPRRPVVHQHCLGQAIAPEHHCQPLAGSHAALIAASLDPQCITRMVVKHRQRMTSSAPDIEVALEIHLPQFVRPRAPEALMRTRMLRRHPDDRFLKCNKRAHVDWRIKPVRYHSAVAPRSSSVRVGLMVLRDPLVWALCSHKIT
jgi:hypothetical protein